jgi:hypothetical protein
MGTDDVTPPMNGHLTDLAGRNPVVALLTEPDFGPFHPVDKAAESGNLLLDAGSQGVRNLDVATLDGNVHDNRPSAGGRTL